MLQAGDREQVLKWSQRQLGKQANLISVTESGCMDTAESVERSGTGIKAESADICQPVMSIMANFLKTMSDAQEDHMDSDRYVGGTRLIGTKQTWH